MVARGTTVRELAEAVGVGRTAASTLIRNAKAAAETAARADPAHASGAALDVLADVMKGDADAEAMLADIARAAHADGDRPGAIAALSELRLARAQRTRTAVARARLLNSTEPPAPTAPTAETHAAETHAGTP